MNDEDLDKPMELTVSSWENSACHCVYLNNHRIAGSKPWGGGATLRTFKGVTIRELARAIPELRKHLGLNCLGKSESAIEDISPPTNLKVNNHAKQNQN